MAGFGRYILSADSRSFLSRRSCLLKISQNIRQNTTTQPEKIEIPPKPKRPQPTFLLYLQTIRPKLIEANPDIKVTEIIHKASKEWNNMDQTVKDGFKNQYSQNYKQYLQNLKEYQESLTDKQKEFLEKQKKKAKDKAVATNIKQKMDLFQKPKRPQNAFLLFLESKRKIEQPRDKLKDWVCDATKIWKTLPTEQKEHYFGQASKLMVDYKEELVKWEQNMVNLGHPDIIRRSRPQKTKEQQKS
ncbi:mitochondrial transcription factor A [Lasioglossum baleicum]|uniref:mitochondrial transcription factor A n=1 Tax=Lasioglossum baleicum TaxID=434251 RepID=UPI003FCDFBA9